MKSLTEIISQRGIDLKQFIDEKKKEGFDIRHISMILDTTPSSLRKYAKRVGIRLDFRKKPTWCNDFVINPNTSRVNKGIS